MANGRGKKRDFAFGKMRGDAREGFVVDVVHREQRYALGPLEGGRFAIGVDTSLAPGGEKVQLGRRDVELAGVVQVILNAECATV